MKNKPKNRRNQRKIREIQRRMEMETSYYFLESLKTELKNMKKHLVYVENYSHGDFTRATFPFFMFAFEAELIVSNSFPVIPSNCIID